MHVGAHLLEELTTPRRFRPILEFGHVFKIREELEDVVVLDKLRHLRAFCLLEMVG